MKYFLDFEFIEDGYTIDPISLGMVREDGKSLYVQFAQCKFKNANDWVWRNVYPYLTHFDFSLADRSCKKLEYKTYCIKPDCRWYSNSEIRERVLEFCNPEKDKQIPEFWGYYADYDWVAFCQIFGRMMNLPKGYPMYCNDLVQLANTKGNPKFDVENKNEHHALADAIWNKNYYEFLMRN